MFGSIFESLGNVVSSTVKVVVAPVAVTATLVEAAVKPLAEVADDLVKDVKDAFK
jgi:hypothetical protein